MAEVSEQMPQLFISYSRDDGRAVYPDADWLGGLGYAVHIDRHISPGEQWREAIANAIADSDLLIFYASPSSIESKFCSQELQFALSRDIPVITVMLAETPFPPWMELALGNHQILQRFDVPQRAYRSLLESGIANQLDQIPPAAPPLTSPRGRWRGMWIGAGAITALVFVLWRSFLPEPLAIAVAPFETDGSLRAAEMAGGVTAELSQGLTNLDLMPVKSRLPDRRPAAGAFVGGSNDASHVIIGHVQLLDPGYRIRTSLIATEDDQEIWAQTFVYVEDDPKEVQHQHVQNLLVALPDVLVGTIPALDRAAPSARAAAQQIYGEGARMLAQPGELQHVDTIRQLFEQALDNQPGFGLALLGLCDAHARTYQESRELDDLLHAETRCLQALAVGSEPLKAHLALGRVFLARGEAQLARFHFQRASAVAPGLAEPLIGLADVADQNGDLEMARAYYEQALALPGTSWEAHLAYGNHLLYQGEFRAAAEQYEVVADLYPAAAIAYVNLGAAWYSLGEFERASQAWRKSVELEPNPMSWGNLGAAQTYARNFSAAANAYREAAALAPSDHRWLGHLGEILAYGPTGDAEEAQRILQQALDLALEELAFTREEQGPVQARISTYEALLGRDADAMARARRVRAEHEDDMTVAYSVLQTYTLLNRATLAARERERLLGLGYPALLLERDPWLN
ncbi:MAG TPA: tetratricopeptide repeat protein [Pseudomonadales bacterium]